MSYIYIILTKQQELNLIPSVSSQCLLKYDFKLYGLKTNNPNAHHYKFCISNIILMPPLAYI